jgi:CDP-diacylglycerol--glycerol-3-phosphate 3-phosphatidyltransferase
MNLPNQLTLGRLGLTAAFVAATSISCRYQATMAIVLFAVAGVTDWLDGWLARRWNLITDFGKLLDPLADKILVTAALFYLVQIGSAPLWMAVVMVAREFLITGLRLIAASKGLVIPADRAGKHKTISQLVAILTALACLAAAELGHAGGLWHVMRLATAWLFAWATLITVASGAWYFWKNRRFVFEATAQQPSG